jgi:hypothetical protein
MITGNNYFNNVNLDTERLVREKKWAKVVIIVACVGILAGTSAGLLFFIQYDLILSPLLAFISGIGLIISKPPTLPSVTFY